MEGPDLTEAIRTRAYEIWLNEGCPHGRDRIHWLRAEAEVRETIAALHSADSCKTGLHEKPVEPRPRGETSRRSQFAGQGSASSAR
jgi:hypothetical protein